MGLFRTRADETEFNFLWQTIKASPPFLYHYTGNTGLRGIVQTSALWATDARFLNDAKEVEIALEAARKVVNDTAQKSSRVYATLLRDETLLQLNLTPKSLYVFSLTENGDSLSHWRGYCRESAGYSIGFKFEDLSEWCESVGLMLSNVRYGTEIYSRDLGKLFSIYIDDLESYFPYFGEGEINSDLLKAYAKRFAQRTLRYAPFIKHEGFSEENEWRIVKFVAPNTGKIEVSFRDGSYSLIPYTVLKLEPLTFFAALGIINVKPSEHAKLCSDGLQWFIRSEAQRHGLAETQLLLTEVSTIPFRPGF